MLDKYALIFKPLRSLLDIMHKLHYLLFYSAFLPHQCLTRLNMPKEFRPNLNIIFDLP